MPRAPKMPVANENDNENENEAKQGLAPKKGVKRVKKTLVETAGTTDGEIEQNIINTSDREDDSDKEVDKKTDDSGDEKDKDKKRIVNGCVSVDLVKQMMTTLPDDVTNNINQKTIKMICDTFVKTVVENVKNGNNVTLTNYLTFKRVLRSERVHKVPLADRTVTKPAHFVMTVDVKPALKKQFQDVVVTANNVANMGDDES